MLWIKLTFNVNVRDQIRNLPFFFLEKKNTLIKTKDESENE